MKRLLRLPRRLERKEHWLMREEEILELQRRNTENYD
jgi:hypothetical protein